MFQSLDEFMFNTSEIERNLFGMADDVYRTIAIFEQAAKFEASIARYYNVLSMIFDCIVFMAVALMIVGMVLQKRFVKLCHLARLTRQGEQIDRTKINKLKVSILKARSASATSLLGSNDEPKDDGISVPKSAARSASAISLREDNDEPEDDGISFRKPDTHDDDEDTLVKKNMVGTTPWAKNWRVSTKISSFGSFYDSWFR